MTVDPTLWEAFYRAAGELLEALEIEAPSHRHVLLELPSNRDRATTLVQATIDSLSKRRREVEFVQSTVGKARALILRGIGDARLSLSPIGCLPDELLRQVLMELVGPDDHKGIMRLASVCTLWRYSINSERHLFIHPDWSKWQPGLLSVWCARARGAPLTVHIKPGVASKLWAPGCLSSKASWSTLHVSLYGRLDVDHEQEEKEDIYDLRQAERAVDRDTLRFILADGLPNLDTLMFDADVAASIHVLAPNLRVLHARSPPRCSEPLQILEELHIHDWTGWVGWEHLIHRSPKLRLLMVAGLGSGRNTSDRSRLTLHGIGTLGFRATYPGRRYSYDVLEAVRSAWFPDVVALHIHGLQLQKWTRTLVSLTENFPSLLTLTLFQDSGDDIFEPTSKNIDKLAARRDLLPQLKELHVIHMNPCALYWQGYPDYEASIKSLVNSRKLSTPRVPILSPDCKEAIEPCVGTLQVKHWITPSYK